MSKRDAAIYREAARLVADVDFIPGEHMCCCLALNKAVRINDLERWDKFQTVLKKFTAVFDPRTNLYWWGSPLRSANKKPRVIALCFAAAMAESGDL